MSCDIFKIDDETSKSAAENSKHHTSSIWIDLILIQMLRRKLASFFIPKDTVASSTKLSKIDANAMFG